VLEWRCLPARTAVGAPSRDEHDAVPARIDKASERCAVRGAEARAGRYNGVMVTRGIRQFVSRDWSAVRASKDAYWGERIARLGAAEGFRIADELRRQMLAIDPAWPDDATRQADLRSHVRVAALLRRAAPARRD
jgi:hypothetical protein